MSDETRGKAIEQRRIALGIKSQHKLAAVAEELGVEISRTSIMKAERGEESVSAATLARIEALLDRLEKAGVPADEADDDEIADGMVEIRAKGDFNVDIVVRGPVRNADKLRQIASDLIREQRAAEREQQ